MEMKDACDVLDESLVGAFDDDENENKQSTTKHDADFDAFAGSAKSLQLKPERQLSGLMFHSARSLQPEEEEQKEDVPIQKVVVQNDNDEPMPPEKQPKEETTTVAVHPTTPDRNKQSDNKDALQAETPRNEKSRYVTSKDFELLKVIGMGAFGKVLQVRNKVSGEVLAMKVISKRLLKRKLSYVENVQAERDILTRIQHPFVVTMHCSFQTKEKLFIIMDFLAGGELFLRLGREGIFLERTAAFYLGEIVLGVDHLHTRGILHRDLKPENILLSIDGHVCLTDFGLAKDFSSEGGFETEDDEQRARTICGTEEYMSPEMLSGRGYGRASDWWSLGCIAYEMLNGEPPFSSRKGRKELFRKIMSEKVKMPVGSTAAACKLLKGLLNRTATARLGAARSTMFEVGGVSGLKQQAFFTNHKIDWEKLEQKEIVPPATLDVDNDTDLRHFHNEFTSMPLPRSVRDMTFDSWEPRRIESEAFRGFSFVQENFALPDRDEKEMEDYWNNPDQDGESLSEAASSKVGEDVVLPEQQEQLKPDKKKRPPRKRKKKKKQAGGDNNSNNVTPSVTPVPTPAVTPLATPTATPAPSENGEVAVVGDDDPANKKVMEEQVVVDKLQKTLETTTKPKPTTTTTAPLKTIYTPPKSNSEDDDWRSVSSVKTSSTAGLGANPTFQRGRTYQTQQQTWQRQQQQPRSKQVHEEQWQQQQQRGGKQQQWQTPTPKNNQKRQQQQTPSPVVKKQEPSNYRPAAGSWAARAHAATPPSQQQQQRPAYPQPTPYQQAPVNSRARDGWGPPAGRQQRTYVPQKQEAPPQNGRWAEPPIRPPPSPSGDWRSKPLARNSPAKTMRVTKQLSSPDAGPLWPSLGVGGDSSPSTTTTTNSNKTPSKPPVRGAWATRVGGGR
uniref:Non-specific serine/threonine protein kinase n=1 Tax=Grammatophora oceanica TaxID=210454 RepID=A0A7S1UVN8_9STRA